MRHEAILASQLEARRNEQHPGEDCGAQTFLLLGIGGSSFLLPILEAKEVSEALDVLPYPAQVPGHLGVVNVRGNVLPVLSLERLFESPGPYRLEESSGGKRMVVLGEKDQAFVVIADSIRKVILSSSELKAGETVSWESSPTKVISRQMILDLWEVEAC